MYAIHVTLKPWAFVGDAEELETLIANNPAVDAVDVMHGGEPAFGTRN